METKGAIQTDHPIAARHRQDIASNLSNISGRTIRAGNAGSGNSAAFTQSINVGDNFGSAVSEHMTVVQWSTVRITALSARVAENIDSTS